MANWYNIQSGEKVVENKNADGAWYNQHHWNWNEKVLKEKMDNKKDIFICGITSNQEYSLDLFDKVFLLTLDSKEISKRRSQRKKENDKEGDEQDFRWHESFNKNLLNKGAIEIRAHSSVSEVSKKILNSIQHKKQEN